MTLLLCLGATALSGRASLAAPDLAAPDLAAVPKAVAPPEAVAGLPLELSASSVLDKAGRRYGPEGLSDPEAVLPWCEGEDGPGPGAWVEARLGGPARAARVRDLVLKILPGYAKAERLYRAHGRPARAMLTLRDRTTGAPVTPQDGYELAFPDSRRVLVFRIPVERSVDPSTLDLRLAMEAVFPGGAFEQLCLSELRVFLDEPAPAPGDLPPDQETSPARSETPIEAAYLNALLPRVGAGDEAALRGLIRLAGGAYAGSAEGGRRLEEVYLDLLVARPWLFLSVLEREDDEPRAAVLAALRDPVTGKYGSARILSALRLAQGRGMAGEDLAELIRVHTLRNLAARNLAARRDLEAARAGEPPPAPARKPPHP